MSEPTSVNYPSSLDDTTSLLNSQSNQSSFILSGDHNNSITTITTTTTISNIAAPNYILLDNELVHFTGISGTNFTGCTRGADGTVAASHSSGISIYHIPVANWANQVRKAIIAIENELGTDPAGSLADLKTRLAVSINDDGTIKSHTVDGQVIIDTGNSEAFLVRLDGDVQDVFTVNTSGAIVGIGKSDFAFGSASKLSINQDASSVTTANIRNVSANSSASIGARSFFDTARGTLASMSAVQNGDVIYEIVARGHDGTDFEEAGWIRILADGTVSDNVVPAKFAIGVASSAGDSSITNFYVDSAGVLGIYNTSSAPSSSPANLVQLYAEDVTASSELKVRDEAGNITTLSPHNFTLFDPDPLYKFPWSYYSKNDFIGVEINVDMYGAIRAIEELTGEQFIFVRNYEPNQTWQEAEKYKREYIEQYRQENDDKEYKEKSPPEWLNKLIKKKMRG